METENFDPATVQVPPVPDELASIYTPEQWAEIVIGDARARWEREQAKARRVTRG